MTRDQLDAIRARLDAVPSIPWNGSLLRLLDGDARALLAEVERLTAEVEMLRGVGCMEDGDGPCGACRKCAFRRGVAAMRESAAILCAERQRDWVAEESSDRWDEAGTCCKLIRALPDPEDK